MASAQYMLAEQLVVVPAERLPEAVEGFARPCALGH